jgi:hypothetical protein
MDTKQLIAHTRRWLDLLEKCEEQGRDEKFHIVPVTAYSYAHGMWGASNQPETEKNRDYKGIVWQNRLLFWEDARKIHKALKEWLN